MKFNAVAMTPEPLYCSFLADLRSAESSRLARLIGIGVVRESPPGRYYLSAPALGDYWFGIRRKRAILIVAIVVVVLVITRG